VYSLFLRVEKFGMSGEPSTEVGGKPEKLSLDGEASFQFHAAYLVYSELFDAAKSEDERKELNQNLLALKQNQIDCETFYRNIARYRKTVPAQRLDRVFFETQRKKDWRMKTQRQERMKRHKR
jgi:hypothetical protein